MAIKTSGFRRRNSLLSGFIRGRMGYRQDLRTPGAAAFWNIRNACFHDHLKYYAQHQLAGFTGRWNCLCLHFLHVLGYWMAGHLVSLLSAVASQTEDGCMEVTDLYLGPAQSSKFGIC